MQPGEYDADNVCVSAAGNMRTYTTPQRERCVGYDEMSNVRTGYVTEVKDGSSQIMQDAGRCCHTVEVQDLVYNISSCCDMEQYALQQESNFEHVTMLVEMRYGMQHILAELAGLALEI